jgi:anti-sigma B factor antagonist
MLLPGDIPGCCCFTPQQEVPMSAEPVVPFPSLRFDKQVSDDTVTAICHGRLISSTTSVMEDEVRAMIVQYQTIVLDLTDLSYMDSSGLGTLVGLYVSAKRAGKKLKLINLSKRVEELLRLTKLISVFEGFGEHL